MVEKDLLLPHLEGHETERNHGSCSPGGWDQAKPCRWRGQTGLGWSAGPYQERPCWLEGKEVDIKREWIEGQVTESLCLSKKASIWFQREVTVNTMCYSIGVACWSTYRGGIPAWNQTSRWGTTGGRGWAMGSSLWMGWRRGTRPTVWSRRCCSAWLERAPPPHLHRSSRKITPRSTGPMSQAGFTLQVSMPDSDSLPISTFKRDPYLISAFRPA